VAEADALDAAFLLDDLLRLAGPALGEGELGLFGLVVGDALGAPAAPLAGIDDEEGVRLVQAVLPRQIAGQHHDAVAGVFVRLLDLLVGAVDGVGALDLVLQDLLCHGHRLEEAGILILLAISFVSVVISKLVPFKLPVIAYCSLIGLLVASPLCPAREFVIEAAGKINFTAPLTMVGAYAGISISDQLKEFAKQGWKMLLIAALVMIGTFTCSAIIAQIVLSLTHVI